MKSYTNKENQEIHREILMLLHHQLNQLKGVGLVNIAEQVKVVLTVSNAPTKQRVYRLPQMIQAIRNVKGIKRFYYRSNRKGIKMIFILSSSLVAQLTASKSN